jgi:glycine/D-amino acid oxidase-like deaminating enzyme
MSTQLFDLAVVGGGVMGLAHAFIAAKAGKRVAVIERDARANGASIRNFGFITVTGQERGDSWRLARRTRDIWAEVADAANITVEQRGLLLTARSAEAGVASRGRRHPGAGRYSEDCAGSDGP